MEVLGGVKTLKDPFMESIRKRNERKGRGEEGGVEKFEGGDD